MTWLIVVLFATIGTDGKLDAYVFTEPSFVTKEECMRGALEPDNIKKFVAKLVSEGLFVDNKISFSFTDKENALGQKYLKSKGLNISTNYVCLFVRDSAYKKKTFPDINFDNWHSTEIMKHAKDNDNPHDFKIMCYNKKT